MKLSAEDYAILLLHMMPEIGPRRCGRLLRCFGSARAVLAAPADELSGIDDMPAGLAATIAAFSDGSAAEREIAAAERSGVEIITCASERYPAFLRNLPDYPPVLFVAGSLESLSAPSVAVVGTRRPTAYGKSAAATISSGLVAGGAVIVSGGARGIDTAAHEAALTAGGSTVAVMGSGIGQPYPPENKKLFEKIRQHGAVVSEFPMDFPPDKGNFPRRNRIIAGLALATVVVEADIKSGALITADFAMEMGKDVFAVPGPVFSSVSRGPHRLIKNGAGLVECAADILEQIAPLYELLPRTSAPAPAGDPVPDAGLPATILRLLDENSSGLSIESIADTLRQSPAGLAASLLDLELSGLVQTLPGNIFCRRR